MSSPYAESPSSVESSARTSAILGVLSMALCMMMLCSCYVTLPIGGIMGLVAFILARGARANDPEGEAKAYANVGMATGLISAAYFGLFLVLIVAYLGLYFVMFFAAMVASILGA